MPTVQAVYVEYDSADARRRIDRFMDATPRALLQGMMFLDQGEMIYVARDLLVADPTGGTEAHRVLSPASHSPAERIPVARMRAGHSAVATSSSRP